MKPADRPMAVTLDPNGDAGMNLGVAALARIREIHRGDLKAGVASATLTGMAKNLKGVQLNGRISRPH